MGFSQSIKERILLDTARHCCVCHRYKGVKVEVHHIIPESISSDNSYENAISLCFDCHADAGHYNPKHPRGTKFSPNELKKAKDRWIEKVNNNEIELPLVKDHFHCRYYLCKCFDIINELSNDNMSKFPVEKPLLIKNKIMEFLNKIISYHNSDYRNAMKWGESYSNIDDFTNKYKNNFYTDRNNFPYFEFIRTPTLEELEKRKEEDGILKLMLEEELPIEEISMVGCYEDGCGGVRLIEEYKYRELWCIFLSVTNISNQYINMNSISGKCNDNNKFNNYDFFPRMNIKIELPKTALAPNESAVIPMMLLLPPFKPQDFISLHDTIYHDLEFSDVNKSRSQVVEHSSIKSTNNADFLVFGHQYLFDHFDFMIDGTNYIQQLHEFDFKNMYTVDRHWNFGSCPHLFFKTNKMNYRREILSKFELKTGKEKFIVPKNVEEIVIAELEDETSTIHYIKIDDIIIVKDLTLNKGDFIHLKVKQYSSIEVKGFYKPNFKVLKRHPSGFFRNKLITRFLRDGFSHTQ